MNTRRIINIISIILYLPAIAVLCLIFIIAYILTVLDQ